MHIIKIHYKNKLPMNRKSRKRKTKKFFKDKRLNALQCIYAMCMKMVLVRAFANTSVPDGGKTIVCV